MRAGTGSSRSRSSVAAATSTATLPSATRRGATRSARRPAEERLLEIAGNGPRADYYLTLPSRDRPPGFGDVKTAVNSSSASIRLDFFLERFDHLVPAVLRQQSCSLALALRQECPLVLGD
jgi:hypothetical protein